MICVHKNAYCNLSIQMQRHAMLILHQKQQLLYIGTYHQPFPSWADHASESQNISSCKGSTGITEFNRTILNVAESSSMEVFEERVDVTLSDVVTLMAGLEDLVGHSNLNDSIGTMALIADRLVSTQCFLQQSYSNRWENKKTEGLQIQFSVVQSLPTSCQTPQELFTRSINKKLNPDVSRWGREGLKHMEPKTTQM